MFRGFMSNEASQNQPQQVAEPATDIVLLRAILSEWGMAEDAIRRLLDEPRDLLYCAPNEERLPICRPIFLHD